VTVFVPTNRLMAGYARVDPAGDWTARLGANRSGDPNADPRMIAQPPTDPGYAMPNADVGNLNQMPGVEVSGWLPANVPVTDPAYEQWLRIMRQSGAIR
jgi:hypothetical protein